MQTEWQIVYTIIRPGAVWSTSTVFAQICLSGNLGSLRYPCFPGFLILCLFVSLALIIWPQALVKRKMTRMVINQTKCVENIFSDCRREERPIALNHTHNGNQVPEKQLRKRILFYNPAFFQRSRNIQNTTSFTNCEIGNCEMTFDKKMANRSDAIIIDQR